MVQLLVSVVSLASVVQTHDLFSSWSGSGGVVAFKCQLLVIVTFLCCVLVTISILLVSELILLNVVFTVIPAHSHINGGTYVYM